MSSKASGQHIIWIEDSIHFCTSKGVTRFLINEHRDKLLLQGKEINLSGQISELTIQKQALQNKLDAMAIISSSKDSIIEVVEEQKDISKKALRKAKRQKIWSDIKSHWRVIVGTASGIAVGAVAVKLSIL